MKNYFLYGIALIEILTRGGVNVVYAANSSLLEITEEGQQAPVPKISPLEAGRLNDSQRTFDLSVIGKCQTNNDPNNELKLDIQGRDMPELFAVNDAGKLIYAQPQPMSVITMPRGHCARVIVELEKIKNNYTGAENVPENIKRSEDYLCLGVRKNSKIISMLYIVGTDNEHASAPVDMDSEEAAELVPLVNSKKLSEGCEIAEPNTVVPEDFIAVGETLDFSSVYRINVRAVTEPVVRIDGANVYVNIKAPFTVNATPQGEITFYDDNKIEDNVGVHTISELTTFDFSGGQAPSGHYNDISSTRGGNFGHNLSKYKIRYSAEKTVKITAITLKNQWMRDYAGVYDRNYKGYKQLILNNGQLGEKCGDNGSAAYSVYFITQEEHKESSLLSEIEGGREAFALFKDSCMELGKENWSVSINDWISEYRFTTPNSNQDNAYLYWNVYGLLNGVQLYSMGGRTNRWHGNTKENVPSVPSSDSWTNSAVSVSNDPQIISAAADDYILQVYILNETNEKHLITTDNVDEAMRKNQGVVLCNLDSDLSTQIVAGDYICFQGDGELSVTVEPTDCTFSHTTPTGQTITTTLTESQTITVDPVNYKYEPCDTGGYVINFITKGVALSLD